MTIEDLEFLYLKRDFEAFELLAGQLQLSLDENERQESDRFLALYFLVRRKYAGDTQFESQLNFYKNIPQGSAHQKTESQLALAEILIFQRHFEEAKSLIDAIIDKTEQQNDQNLKIQAVALKGNWHLEQNQFKEALALIQKYIKHNKPAALSVKSQLEARKTLVQALLKVQDYNGLEINSKILLELSRKNGDIEKEIIALNNLAIVYSVHNDYKNAMAFFLEALDQAAHIGYRQSIANALINIGTIYAQLQNHEQALVRYRMVLEDYHDILENNTLAVVYNNTGNIYYLMGDAIQSKLYFEKSLELAQLSQYREMIVLTNIQLSKVFRMLGDNATALKWLEKSQALMDENDDHNSIQIYLITLAELHFDEKDYKNALQLALDGLERSKEADDDRNTLSALNLISSIYADVQNFEAAYQFQLEYSRLQDQVVIEKSRLHAIDIEIRYNIKEKQQQIEQLKIENAYQGKLIHQGKQIAVQNTQLLNANEELQQFAYIISHDLKEPLRMIASYAQLIIFKYHSEVDEHFQTYLNFISEGVTRMNALLDGLLQYGTIGKENEEIVLIDLRDIINDACFNLKLMIRESQAEITVGKMPILEAHPSRMIQLFQNLISNAIKFRKSNTLPRIAITCEKEGLFYRFRVQDNGIGIEADHQDRVFAIFQRLHTRQKYDGTGIGLSICQKIVQHFGGSIWVESSLGSGSTFCFDLPVKTSEHLKK